MHVVLFNSLRGTAPLLMRCHAAPLYGRTCKVMDKSKHRLRTVTTSKTLGDHPYLFTRAVQDPRKHLQPQGADVQMGSLFRGLGCPAVQAACRADLFPASVVFTWGQLAGLYVVGLAVRVADVPPAVGQEHQMIPCRQKVAQTFRFLPPTAADSRPAM